MSIIDAPALTPAAAAKLFPTVTRTLWDDFSQKANGALSGTAMGSGQTWATTQSGTGSTGFTVASNKMVVGSLPSSGSASYYASTTLAGGALNVGASFVFPSGGTEVGTNAPTIALIAWDRANFTSSANAAVHLVVTTRNVQVGYWANSSFTLLKTFNFSAPLPLDQELRCEWLHDPLAGAVYVLCPDGSVRTAFNPLLHTVPTMYTQPCWEVFNVLSSASLATTPYFTTVWAGNQAPKLPFRSSTADRRDVLSGAGHGLSGAGTQYERPCSINMQGVTWWDTTLNALVVGTPNGWVNAATATTVGNLYPAVTSLMLDDGTNYATSNAAKAISRSITAPGRSASLSLTSAASGTIVAFPTGVLNATAGTSYSSTVRIYAAGTARTFTVTYFWYDSSSAQISTSSASAISTGSATWTSLPVFTATAPTSTAKVLVQIVINGAAAAGEVFYVSELCVAAGTITGFIEP